MPGLPRCAGHRQQDQDQAEDEDDVNGRTPEQGLQADQDQEAEGDETYVAPKMAKNVHLPFHLLRMFRYPDERMAQEYSMPGS